MNVLCIGNSFSVDATRYLHQIARADGENIHVVNLYIGGCSLDMHFRNMMGDSKSYELYLNGHSSGFFVSIKEALLSRKWDIVTMQQVSHQSVDYATFQPFLSELSAYVRKYAPTAKQYLHQTWAYQPGYEKMTQQLGFPTHADMYRAIKAAYAEAAAAIDADLLIPSGAVMNQLLESGFETIHRDPIHASLGIGRYALGLLWYKVLSGKSITDNTFRDFDEAISEEEVALIKNCVDKIY